MTISVIINGVEYPLGSSDRPPTPAGWSDTDWIKHLQYHEENPMACLHINQGSFNAAADAYEDEYNKERLAHVDPMVSVDLLASRLQTPKGGNE